VLDLSYNRLTGSIPTESLKLYFIDDLWSSVSNEYMPANTTVMKSLVLSSNHLESKVPSELGLMVDLNLLDVSNNDITGEIPSELGKMFSCSSQIILLGNNFSRSLPESLCPWYCHSQKCSLGLASNGSAHFPAKLGLCGQIAIRRIAAAVIVMPPYLTWYPSLAIQRELKC
jgi:hypothetical protein